MWAGFNGPGWQLKVRLDADFDDDFQPAPVSAPVHGGDVFDFEESNPP
jgi:hypothetical protein